MHNTCWPLVYVPQGVVTGDRPCDCSLEICSASCVDTNRNPEYREARSKSLDFPVHHVRPGPLVTYAAFRGGPWEVTFVRFGLVGIRRAPYPREHLRISETCATCRFVHYRRRRSRARSRLDRAIPTRPDSDGQMSNALSPPVVAARGCLARSMHLRSHAVVFWSNRQGGKPITFNAEQDYKQCRTKERLVTTCWGGPWTGLFEGLRRSI